MQLENVRREKPSIEGAKMIARMWHGMTRNEKAEEYSEFLRKRAIPDYQSVPGNLSVHILRREDGANTHFITLTFWDSMKSIEGFAGVPVDKAKYYDEDREFLLEFEPKVMHWEVVGKSGTSPEGD
jgi:heme-degrading monooxygenase HmoA